MVWLIFHFICMYKECKKKQQQKKKKKKKKKKCSQRMQVISFQSKILLRKNAKQFLQSYLLRKAIYSS